MAPIESLLDTQEKRGGSYKPASSPPPTSHHITKRNGECTFGLRLRAIDDDDDDDQGKRYINFFFVYKRKSKSFACNVPKTRDTILPKRKRKKEMGITYHLFDIIIPAE